MRSSGTTPCRVRPLAALAAALALAGCSDSRPWQARVTNPVPDTAPAATTPENAVRALEWSWEHQDLASYRALLSADFQFGCAATDSAGNTFRDRALTRDDELVFARHLFTGGGARPPASRIRLDFDPNLISRQDSRPGKGDEIVRREIATAFLLRVETDSGDFHIPGAARFFLVRGDSARIPPDLPLAAADPGWWYVEGWEDESIGGNGGLRAQPTGQLTLCALRARYR